MHRLDCDPCHSSIEASRSATPSPIRRKDPPYHAALAIAMLVATWAGASSSSAQPTVFYGEVDETLRVELSQWSAHY